MTDAEKIAAAAHGIDPSAGKVAAVVVVGPFMTQMDATAVNVSLTAIRQELHSSIATSQWIVSGYLGYHTAASWPGHKVRRCRMRHARQLHSVLGAQVDTTTANVRLLLGSRSRAANHYSCIRPV
ncbi:MAG: hypothetical protein P4L91_05570 [Burkholderiaceae bacterium]|nr:hypothetical protein [Burkholderiaceae bacterium]